MTPTLLKIRRLTQALFLSGGLNIVLLTLLLYGLFWDGFIRWRHGIPPHQWPRLQTVVLDEASREYAIQKLLVMPFGQLVETLKSNRRLDERLMERELALGLLVTFYYFDLKQALGGNDWPAMREVILDDVKVSVPIALSSEQYKQIAHFAQVERWPLTSKGLFLALKNGEIREPSLTDAFWQSPEFLLVQRLFARSHYPVNREALLKIILKQDWETLEQARTLEQFLDSYAVTEEAIALNPAPPVSQLPKEILHTVQNGDSLWKIAKKYGVSVARLKEINELTSDVVRPGRVLKITR